MLFVSEGIPLLRVVQSLLTGDTALGTPEIRGLGWYGTLESETDKAKAIDTPGRVAAEYPGVFTLAACSKGNLAGVGTPEPLGVPDCSDGLEEIGPLQPCMGYSSAHDIGLLVTIGTLVKGRSSAQGLLRLARSAGVVQMVLRIRPYFRWVRSEHNLADGPSRGERVGIATDTEAKGMRYRGVQRKTHLKLQQFRRKHGFRGHVGL